MISKIALTLMLVGPQAPEIADEPALQRRVSGVLDRRLAGPGEPRPLFESMALEAWSELGDALWSLDADGVLTGRVGGGAQSFLVSDASYGDFVLEVDVRTVGPGNSGIQFRSHIRPDGRLFGYQAEIDPSARAWSGGLYDEGRRGWLANLEDDERARAAFEPGEWNRYRIECVGPRIRIWIDDIPTVDTFDPLSLEGRFAFQVHSGADGHVQFRHARLWQLGRARWERLDPHIRMDMEHGHQLGAQRQREGAFGVRWREGDTWSLAWGADASTNGLHRSDQPLELRGPRMEINPRAAVALAPPAYRHTISGDLLPEAEHELVVTYFAGRLTLHVNGALIAEHESLDLGRHSILSGPGPTTLHTLEWHGSTTRSTDHDQPTTKLR